jgi:hypothetical protein
MLLFQCCCSTPDRTKEKHNKNYYFCLHFFGLYRGTLFFVCTVQYVIFGLYQGWEHYIYFVPGYILVCTGVVLSQPPRDETCPYDHFPPEACSTRVASTPCGHWHMSPAGAGTITFILIKDHIKITLQFNDLRSDHIFLYNWPNRTFSFSRQF